MLQNHPELESKINQLWNKFWAGGIANPLTAIEQITYLLFMKRLDDLDAKKLRDAEFLDESYASKFEGYWIPPENRAKVDDNKPIDEALKEKEDKEEPFRVDKATLRWSHFKNFHAEEMLIHVQTKVFPFLKELNGDESPFTHHMKNAVFIIPKPSLLTEAISTIDDLFVVMEKDSKEGGQAFQDIQGDVYEMLLNEIASAGKNGQFRTPRHIIKLVAELVDPQLGDTIADPACGTAGFLLGAFQYILTQISKNKDSLQPDEDGFLRSSVSGSFTEDVSKILNESLYGYDFDVTMVRLGLMNLMMHGVDTPHIDYKDTLSKSYDETNRYNKIMANPPFTGSIDKGDINENLTLNTTKTELLFLEQIHNMLAMGGTAGVVIPQGVLFGSGKAFVEARKILIEQCELKAVVSLPSGVFKPYAGVSTAILVFTKGGETEKVWFYDMESDGYSLDDKRTKLEGYGDLQDIVTRFKSRHSAEENDRKGKFFFVPKDEIVQEKYDLSFSRYKEEVFEEIEYDAPAEILAKLKALEGEIGNELNELEGMLG